MTVKELKAIMESLPDEMEVVCLVGDYDVKNSVWPIEDYLIIDKPEHHNGLYLHHG